MMEIRPFQKSDINQLLHLLRLNTPEYFSPNEQEDFIHYLNFESENYFVLSDGQEIVGCGGYNFWDEGKIARISWDILHPNHQGKGHGSHLLEFRLNKIKQIKSVENIVVRTSQLVYRFYEKFGFQTVEIVKDYWDEGFDLYYMMQKV